MIKIKNSFQTKNPLQTTLVCYGYSCTRYSFRTTVPRVNRNVKIYARNRLNFKLSNKVSADISVCSGVTLE